MTARTLAELAAATGVEPHDHLPTDIDIPVLAGLQAQGDLLVIPAHLVPDVHVGIDGWTDVPAAGIELLRGAAGGNPHMLVADPGTCRYTTNISDPERLALGAIETTETVWLLHPEHGGSGIAAGTFIIRRQREQAEEQRLVAD
ncbi:MAG: hypothetical protein JWN67_5067 [Actinomycetia bacterium]|nr:hypothetical protein [Actinomycetes bacterium]